MSALTGGFDAVMEVNGAAVERLARQMHQAGSASHATYTVNAGGLVTAQLGAPSIELVPSSTPKVHVIATSRALCRVRSLEDPAALGGTAVISIKYRGRIELPPGDAAPIDGDAVLSVDWQQTTAADIVVLHASDPPTAAAIRDALTAQAAAAPPALFNIGVLTEAGISSVGLHVTPIGASGTTPVLAMAFNLFGARGTRNAIPNFVDGDWSIVLSDELVLSRVREALERQLGALPPPAGNTPLRLGAEQVCVVPTALGCLISTTATMWLDELHFALTAAGIELTGTIRRDLAGMPSGALTATWKSTITPSIAPDGTLQVVATTSVFAQSWVAQIANAISSGALESATRDAIAGVLVQGLGTADPTELLGIMLRELGHVGRTVGTAAEPRPMRAECGPDGVVVHGSLAWDQSVSKPQAQLGVLGTIDAGRVLLSAEGSWAPGGDIQTVKWDLGDGIIKTLSGDQCALAIEHIYASGVYTPSVTVTDGAGRSATAKVTIEPGRLALRHHATDMGFWEQCARDDGNPVSVRVSVSTCFTDLPGIKVTAKGDGWSVSAVTDDHGVANLSLNMTDVRRHPAPGTPPQFSAGGVAILADSPGFQFANARLEMIDCDALWAIVMASKRHRDEALDRLAGYAAARELRDKRPTSLDQYLGIPGVAPSPPVNRHSPVEDDLVRRATDVRALTAALDAITNVIEFGGGPDAAARLLGIKTDQVHDHLGKMWSGVVEQGREIETQLRSRPGPDRPSRPKTG